MSQKQKNEDKPSAFKHWINESVVNTLATALSKVSKDFNQHEFRKISKELPPLELKARVQLLSQALYQHLPKEFPQSSKLLLKSLEHGKLSGFMLWPYTEYIQSYGLAHRQKSLEALAQITELFTAEFAVRPFLKKYTHETLGFLLNCAGDSNVHLRRWSSEGSRPRLPWGERLDVFIQNPRLTLPILEELKYDEELYVRKSVANHLNDIAKDHPSVVLQVLAQWKKQAPDQHKEKIDWITRHSLRTLIKKGNPHALKLMGVSAESKVKVEKLALTSPVVAMGKNLEFQFKISSQSSKKQKLIVDYIIYHQKVGGKLTPKVFKLKTFELGPKESLLVQKKHSFKPVTTRKYYPGAHRIEIQVNGKIFAKKDWVLR